MLRIQTMILFFLLLSFADPAFCQPAQELQEIKKIISLQQAEIARLRAEIKALNSDVPVLWKKVDNLNTRTNAATKKLQLTDADFGKIIDTSLLCMSCPKK